MKPPRDRILVLCCVIEFLVAIYTGFKGDYMKAIFWLGVAALIWAWSE